MDDEARKAPLVAVTAVLGFALGFVAGFFLPFASALLDPTDDDQFIGLIGLLLLGALATLAVLAAKRLRRYYAPALFGAVCGLPVGIGVLIWLLAGLATEIGE